MKWAIMWNDNLYWSTEQKAWEHKAAVDTKRAEHEFTIFYLNRENNVAIIEKRQLRCD